MSLNNMVCKCDEVSVCHKRQTTFCWNCIPDFKWFFNIQNIKRIRSRIDDALFQWKQEDVGNRQCGQRTCKMNSNYLCVRLWLVPSKRQFSWDRFLFWKQNENFLSLISLRPGLWLHRLLLFSLDIFYLEKFVRNYFKWIGLNTKVSAYVHLFIWKGAK